MSFLDLFRKKYQFIGIDVGPSSIKFVELKAKSGNSYEVVRLGNVPTAADLLVNNVVAQPQIAAEAIQKHILTFDTSEHRASFSIPAPIAFTKKAKMQQMSYADFKQNLEFEAVSLIPHAINAVYLDSHVIGESGKGQMDVMLIVVKREIVDKFADVMQRAGIEPGIADVEYFAVQNAFEANYPELHDKTVALIELGSKYAAINIVKSGSSLFCGEINIGGNNISESLAEVFGISLDEAERLKQLEQVGDERMREAALDILEKNVEHLASEMNRQLNFFASAADLDSGIDLIMLSGGAAHTRGLPEALSQKTGIQTSVLDPFHAIEISPSFAESIRARSSYTVSVGLALRRFGDKVIPDFM